MKRIIFTGKGGVGKTTILSTLSRMLARDGYKVLAIDCDPSMNLAMSLGVPLTDIVSLSDDKSQLQEKLGAGMNGHAHHGQEEIDETIDDFVIEAADGVELIVMGTIPYGGAGCLCSPISLVKLLISYISKSADEHDFILVDSQAGVEIFGRGLASEFDMAFVITEPTPKSMEVAKHGMKLSTDLGVRRQIVVANKVENGSDREEMERYLGDVMDGLVCVGFDRAVLEADKKGLLLLDFAPGSQAVTDVLKIKSLVEA